MARYRYIVDDCDPNDSISSYWLRRSAKDAAKLVPGVGEIIYRVHIPEGMVMEWKPRAGLYITEDSRTIAELGYDILMNTWNDRQVILKPGADVKWLAKREKRRWAFAMHQARQEAGVMDYVDEPCDVSVGEWFSGR